jgi:sensor histidine kinase YesM
MSRKGERMTDILLGFILFFIILTDVLIYQIAMNQVGMNKWNIDMFDRIRRGQFDFFNVMERKIDRLDANQQRLNVMVKEIKGEKNETYRRNE